MSSQSAKRRRSNSSNAIAVENPLEISQEAQPLAERASPSRRASSRSPTKASLARSHPNVLSRVLDRSAAERARRSASRGHEEELIGNGETIAEDVDSTKTGPGQGSTSRDTESPIKRANPTTNLPHRPSTTGGEQSRASHAFSPGHVTSRDTAELPEHDDGIRGPSSEDGDIGEPELPPTPTELGLEKPPPRTKSLLSSSPSLRHEVRRKKRRKAAEELKSSPLKGRGIKAVGEAGKETNPRTNVAQGNPKVPDKVRKKELRRDELSAQLERLREEITELEYEARRSERPHDHPEPSDEYLKKLMTLITSATSSTAPPAPKRPPPPSISSSLSFLLPFSARHFIPKTDSEPPPSPLPPNPFAVDQHSNPAPYLTLFSPLSLYAHTATVPSSTVQDSDGQHSYIQKHELTLSAPPEYPTSYLRVPLTVYSDPEKHSVISISVNESSNSASGKADSPKIPKPLRDWIDTRVSNFFLKLDVSGLCWGVCRYWEAAVSRAKVWSYLETVLSRVRDGKPPDTLSRPGDDGTDRPRDLQAHLDRSSFLFSVPGGKSEAQLLVTCALNLDPWTSEPQLEPDICITSPATTHNKVEGEARKAFWSVLRGHRNIDATVLAKAVESVVTAVFERR